MKPVIVMNEMVPLSVSEWGVRFARGLWNLSSCDTTEVTCEVLHGRIPHMHAAILAFMASVQFLCCVLHGEGLCNGERISFIFQLIRLLIR